MIKLIKRKKVQQHQLNTMPHNYKNVFAYANHCEYNFRQNVSRDGLIEVKTTFFSDLSIAEWCEQINGEKNAVKKTITEACEAWWGYPEYIIELLFAVSMKSWEQYTLGSGKYEHFRAFGKDTHMNYARYYGERFHTLRDEVIEHYKEVERYDIVEQIYNAID